MPDIDNKVVGMKFDNADFVNKIGPTLSFLDKLKQSLNFTGSTKGMEELKSAANNVSSSGMNPLGVAVEGVSGKFLAMSTIAVTALSNIVNKAMSAGKNIVDSLSLDPIMGGFREYELKLGSVQTILSNTSAAGTNLEQVNAVLRDLNTYSDQTIYNFGEMAKNIGTFTAAGVDLETATGSIKGIANLAALSGSNSQQASTAMYQLSQAISAGRVSLMDWNSVVNAGMGGSVFQRALAETAVAMGKLPDSALKLDGAMKNVSINGKSFRESISAEGGDSWLTSDVLTTALKNFTGDMKEADLVAQGFTKTQAQSIINQAAMAKDAATVVKTGTQLMGTLKESAESGWAETWEIIIGDFEEAKKLWTGLNNAIGGAISGSAERRNELLKGWKAMGGRDVLLEGLARAAKSLGEVFGELKQTFREFFPSMTSEKLYDLTTAFVGLLDKLKPSDETVDRLARTFAGLLAVVQIVGRVVMSAGGAIIQMFKGFGDGGGSLLEVTAKIGDFLVALNAAIRDSSVVGVFFNNLASIIAIPLKLLGMLTNAITGLFDGFSGPDAQGMVDGLDGVNKSFSSLVGLEDRIEAFFYNVARLFSKVKDTIVNALSGIGEYISRAFGADSYTDVLATINTGLLAGITLMIKKFFSGGINVDVGGGFFDNVKETLGAVTESLQTMQANVKANIILKIAGSLALLAGAIAIIAGIDPADIAKAMATLAAGFVGLQFALVSLANAVGPFKALRLPFLAASIGLLAGSLVLLALAIKLFATMEFGDMLRGLFGMGAALFIIQKAMIPLSANAGGMIRAAAALTILGVALNLIAVAMKIFGTMDLEETGRALVALGGALAIIIATMRLLPKGMVAQAAAIAILAAALNGIAIAMKIFATFDLDDTAKALVAMGGALVVIAGAMRLMPKNMVAQAAALVLVAGAVNGIAVALKVMGTMSWEDIAQGLVALGGSLLILAVGLNAMNGGAILGAAALLVAATALAVLTPVLVTLGTIPWPVLLQGLAALAGIFVVLGAAGFILAPVVPVILGLGVALVAIGAGLALAGVGALAFATAFGIVVATGTAGIEVLAGVLRTFTEAIPGVVVAFAEGVVGFVMVIAENAPKMVSAFAKIMSSFLDSIIMNTPKIGQLFLTLITTGLNVLIHAVPRMAEAGLRIILGVLNAIASKVGQIVTVATDLAVNFMNAIGANAGRLADAGAKMIINFINATANAVRNNSEAMGQAGANLGTAIIEGMARGIGGGLGVIKNAAVGVAKSALGAAKNFLGIKSPSREFAKIGMFSSEGFAVGIAAYSGRVENSAERVGSVALDSIRNSMALVADAVSGDINLSPTVTPVIDLTQFKKDAGLMTGLVGVSAVRAEMSFGQASRISMERQAAREAELAMQGASAGSSPVVKFEQNNYSPEALSVVDIYRNTNNQLSQIEDALRVPRQD